MSGEQSTVNSTSAFDRLGVKIVSLLLLLQLICVILLWTLDPVGEGAQEAFALYLAAVLISFAMVSYVYRALKRSDRFARPLMLAGCFFIVTLLLLGLVF